MQCIRQPEGKIYFNDNKAICKHLIWYFQEFQQLIIYISYLRTVQQMLADRKHYDWPAVSTEAEPMGTEC